MGKKKRKTAEADDSISPPEKKRKATKSPLNIVKTPKSKRNQTKSDTCSPTNTDKTPTSKRKQADLDSSRPSKRPRQLITCILHNAYLTNHGDFRNFKSLNDNKRMNNKKASEQLAHLHEIQMRRLAEPPDSPYRMKTICDQIPETVDGADMERVGYHKGCYAHFTSNLHRLNDSNECTTPQASVSHHSPRKNKQVTKKQLFPPECIFCGKIEIKVAKKTLRPVPFPSWKDKKSPWKAIEPKAKVLKNSQLYRLINGVDLFAVEAKHHVICLKRFNTTYNNHLLKKKKNCTDNDKLMHAHNEAYKKIQTYIQKHVIDENEVLQVSLLTFLYRAELENQGSPNDDFRTEKLINHINKDGTINEHITFAPVKDKGCIMYLVP